MGLASYLPLGPWRDRLQVGRYEVNHFIRTCAIPHLKEGVRVLDAGSGNLEEQHLREELLATGAELVTLDLVGMPGVDVVAELIDTGLEGGSFDVILCTQVLQYCENPSAVARELFRILRKGGELFVTAPQGGPTTMNNVYPHYFHFTKEGLRVCFEREGFQLLEARSQGNYFANLAHCLHYSVVVVSRFPYRPRWVFRLIELVMRVLIGGIAKSALILLDRLDDSEENVIGWGERFVKK